MITGDFNLNYLDDSNKRKLSSVFGQYDLTQLIQEPTHFTENPSSLIDLVFTKNTNLVVLSGVGEAFLDQNIRYHCPVYAVFNLEKHKQPCYKRKIWMYDHADYARLNQLVSEFDWSEFKSNDINSYALYFTDTILEFCNMTIPNKLVIIRPSAPPWLNSSVRRAIRKRKRAHKRAKRLNTEDAWSRYKLLRNESIRILRTAKQDHKKNLTNKLTDNSISSKDWWKFFKMCLGKDAKESIPPLSHNDKVINDPNEKADLFNTFFQSQSQLDDTNIIVPTLPAPTVTIDSIHLETQEIYSILKTLQIGKACGPDMINNRILREIADSVSPVLTDIFNTSLSTAKVPDIWKQSNVSPVFKKDDKTNVENYRPISLISSVGKTFEKAVYKHIHNFILANQIITPFQSGFMPGDSTVNQLTDMYNTFCRALDEGKEVRVVFCDINKAFDRVWHRGLLAKLYHYGIIGNLHKWFENYLTDRIQRVTIPGGSSDWVSVNAGVPQGSILGPLLFLLYINDIVHEINSSIRLFADDTSIYIIVDFPDSAAQILNIDLERIANWAAKWLVNFNANKNESMLISRKILRANHPILYFNNVSIEQVQSHKHLGIYLSDKCEWHVHLENTEKKAWSRVHLLRSLKFDLDRKSLQTMYFSFIRPVLEYADVVWDNCTQQQMNDLEKIQLEAGRIVSGTTKLVAIDRLYRELGWLKLSERRKMHKLFLFYKMQNGLVPDYLTELVPSRVGDNTTYSLRNAEHLQQIHASSRLFFDSFLPSTIREWNRLPSDTKSAPSLSSFK